MFCYRFVAAAANAVVVVVLVVVVATALFTAIAVVDVAVLRNPFGTPDGEKWR